MYKELVIVKLASISLERIVEFLFQHFGIKRSRLELDPG